MIKLLGSLDKKKHYYVGVSGGVDSMAAFHFLKQMKYNVQPLFFNHQTPTSEEAQRFLLRQPIHCQPSSEEPLGPCPKGKSQEEHWRDKRYAFFHLFEKSTEIIVAHHLDDVVETWVWGSLHGQPKIIPYRNRNVIRPFLTTPKARLMAWATKYQVPYLDDPSNFDTRYQRNYIRHVMMPQVLQINPGIGSMLRKKVLARGTEDDSQR